MLSLNLLCSPAISRFTQNTYAAVSTETSLKAVGRPAFTLYDKEADLESRKYSATKELLYQGLCLGMYLSIIPLFKRAGYWGLSKIIKNENPNSIEPKNFKEFYIELEKVKGEQLTGRLKTLKGAIELSSIVGSVIALTMIAPAVSNQILHPIMKFFGIKKDKTVAPADSRQIPAEI